MIRFLPDTWLAAILRPVAMADPSASVYVEISAPDWRFLFILALLPVALLAHRRRRWRMGACVALGFWMLLAFAMWLGTTGNGRYFIPVLLLAGPFCMALVCRLPGTRGLKASIAVLAVALQGWVVWWNTPWQSWGFAAWTQAPYFEISLDEQARRTPATYVTALHLSYSLVAPQFPAGARWINIAALPAADSGSVDSARAQRFLAGAQNLQFLIPAQPSYMDAEGRPGAPLFKVMNDMLSAQKLRIPSPASCRFLPSRGILAQAYRQGVDQAPAGARARYGFWICPLQYPVVMPPVAVRTAPDAVLAALAQIERQCPRYFEPGQKAASRIDDGWVRVYPQSDFRVYALDDGGLYYRYPRLLNPVRLGDIASLAEGRTKIDCAALKGRSRSAWDAEI